MLQTIYAFTQQTGMFRNCTGVVAGVSGGPDSMAMLDILVKNKDLFPFSIVCATVNHNLRPEAAQEAEDVEKYCREKGIPFELLSADVQNTCPKGTSLEDYARQIRYRFFEEIKKKYGFSHSATAHTADDNCESRLLNLIRGCGSDGLAGIAPLRPDTKTARPLLCCTKKQLLDYCKKNGVHYSLDPTNTENIYRRNIVRNRILPEIRTLNPDFPEALERLSVSATRDNDFLRKQAENLAKTAKKEGDDDAFSLTTLQDAHPAVLSRFLRDQAKKTGGKPLSFPMTENLLALVRSGKSGSRADFYGGYARIAFDCLIFRQTGREIQTFPAFTPSEGINSIAGTNLRLKLTEGIYDGHDKNCIKFLSFADLTVRPRKEGDYLHPENRPAGGRSFKRLLYDKKIPVFERDKIPLIVSKTNGILWTAVSGRETNAVPELHEKSIQIELFESE